MDLENTIKRTDSAGRIEFLDSIRGLAALAVLLGHTAGFLMLTPSFLHLLQIPFFNAGIDGKAAVAMFFVLSGLVLSRPYLKSSAITSPRPLRITPFYVKRITRIYIPFLCALSLSALAKLWWFRSYSTIPAQTSWFQQFWSEPLLLRGFLKQCFFLVHDPSQQLLNQDWSLGIELKASALLPFLLLAFRRGRRWLLAIVCALLFWRTGQFYISFILGILLAAHQNGLVSQIKNRKLQLPILGAGLVCYQMGLFWKLMNAREGYVAVKFIWISMSVGCVLILLATFSSQRIQKVLNHGFFVFLGRISYGVYLLQFIILLCIMPWFVNQLNAWGLQRVAILTPTIMIATALITIAAAIVFYKLVEQPGIRLGHHFASAYNRKFAQKSEPVVASNATQQTLEAGRLEPHARV